MLIVESLEQVLLNLIFTCCEIEKADLVSLFELNSEMEEILFNAEIIKNNNEIFKFLNEFSQQLHYQFFMEEYILKNNLKNLFNFIKNNSIYNSTNPKTILRITYLKLNFKSSYYFFKVFSIISYFLGKNNIKLKNKFLKNYKKFLLNKIEILINYYYQHKQKYIKNLQEAYWILNNFKTKDQEVNNLLNKLKKINKNLEIIVI